MISNWLAFAVLVYSLGVGAHWWAGPVALWHRSRNSRQERRTDEVSDGRHRWSDMSDTDDEDGADLSVSDMPSGDVDLPVVEHAPGVYTQPDPRVRVVRLPAGPRPLDDLRRESGLSVVPPGTGEDAAERRASSPAARRAWVRQQLRAGARSGDVVTQGAARWGCSAKTIERDIAMQRAKEDRAHRRP